MDPNRKVELESGIPFGTLPHRGRGPLILLGAAYLIWGALLAWMALSRIHLPQ